MKKTFLAIIASAFSILVSAQKPSREDAAIIDRIDKIVSANYPPGGTGATVIVTRKGQEFYQKAFGMANLELSVPMKPEHVFRIGSITKQFTAVAILQLLEQGKLDLGDDITKFIPGYPTHGYKITIEHLLNHTSGIKSYTDMPEWDEAVQRKDFTPEALVDYFKYQPMDFAPGTKWNYNNSGYVLLGVIIEKVSGISYEKYLEENFFKPLGMKDSYYGNDRTLIRNRVSGYEPGKDTVTNTGYLSMTQPYSAGSILSTVADLAKWNQAVMTYKLLKKETLDLAFRNKKLPGGQPMNYGFGWALGVFSEKGTIEHSGGINGSLTNAIYYPEKDIYIAVLSNCTCKPPTETSVKILAAMTSTPIGDYKVLSTLGLDLKKYEGVYENEFGMTRYIRVEGDSLKSQRSGGSSLTLYMYAPNKFFYRNSLANLEFVEENGKIVAHRFQSGTEFPTT